MNEKFRGYGLVCNAIAGFEGVKNGVWFGKTETN